jgi:hypothetical protein
MEAEHKHGGEIVIRITPRNLERLIYVLIIIGLIVLSIVGFNRTSTDCPVIECDAPVQEATTNAVLEGVTESETESEDNKTTIADLINVESTTTPTPSTSGKIEFSLKDVKTCVVDEDLGRGRFDSIEIKIINGLDRESNLEIQLYLWNEDDSFDLITHLGPKIEDIKILKGATYSRTFKVDLGHFSSKGYFMEVGEDKKVKAVLIDSDLNKEITFIVNSNIKTTVDC